MQKFIIASSILSANFAKLGEEVDNVIQAGADWVHFDVMDNHFVPNLTIGPMVCKALKNHGVKAPIDVHLMVNPVDTLVTSFAKAGANMISFHPEASEHVESTLSMIRELGCKAGIALNPESPVTHLDGLLDKLDMILLMSVNPGFGGQQFMPAVLNKIKEVRSLIDKGNYDIRIEVDGGINTDTIKQAALAGADTFVAGSAIFNSDNYANAINAMRTSLDEC